MGIVGGGEGRWCCCWQIFVLILCTRKQSCAKERRRLLLHHGQGWHGFEEDGVIWLGMAEGVLLGLRERGISGNSLCQRVCWGGVGSLTVEHGCRT